jgi:hypothetical protein
MDNKPGVMEAISAAFERTKNIMFRPMRYSLWWRFAVIGALAGESAGGGGFNQGLNIPSRARDHLAFAASPSTWWFDRVAPEVIAMAIVVACLLAVIFLFISSVMRFILFDAVLRGRVAIRAGWSRWKNEGAQFFLLHIAYTIFLLFSAGALLLIPVIPIFRHGGFQLARLEWPEVLLVIFGFVVFFVWLVILLVIWVLLKDFVVPMMALEGLTPMDAVRKVRHLVNRNFGSFSGYIGMKIVLSVGAGVLFGIVDFMIIFACLIPVGILAAMGIAIGAGAGLTWHDPLAIVLAIAFGGVALAIVIYLVALVNSPAVVFFQSYVIHYLGPRYLPLEAVLNPPPPPAPPASPTELAPAPA